MMQELPLSDNSPAQHPTHSVPITQATQLDSASSYEDTNAPRYLLKVYQGTEKSKLIELYKQEATISQFLCRGNPHLVKFIGSGQLEQAEFNSSIFKFKDEAHYIIYEFCSSNELFYYASNQVTYLDTDLCHILFVQILQGIAYMHSRNVCHYDIKLENIMLDDTFSVKVIDFGLSGSNKIFSNDVKGTLGYIAPEFCKNPAKKEALKGEKADVFALGVVLFGLYFGFLPFESTNYCDFEASPLCSGDSEKVEQFLKRECPMTKDILG